MSDSYIQIAKKHEIKYCMSIAKSLREQAKHLRSQANSIEEQAKSYEQRAKNLKEDK